MKGSNFTRLEIYQLTTQLQSEGSADGFWTGGVRTELEISWKCGSPCQARGGLDLACPGMVRQGFHNQEAFQIRRACSVSEAMLHDSQLHYQSFNRG